MIGRCFVILRAGGVSALKQLGGWHLIYYALASTLAGAAGCTSYVRHCNQDVVVGVGSGRNAKKLCCCKL